ncbi:NlpC/P60 family protein [Actinoplanes sp. NPDC024001]|uniref:C40 family peptidase n=1 Tax=Actinoplanes sp. NPDC024001 TaxID=3154598 RepID=UPI0033FF1625
MTAGAIALAVIAPALEPVEHAAEAVTMPPRALPATPEPPALPLREEIQERQFLLRDHKSEIPLRASLQERETASQRASRSIPRRPAVRPVTRVRPVVAPASRRPVRLNNRPAARIAERPAARIAERPAQRRVVVHQKRTSVSKRGSVAVRTTTRSTAVRRLRTNPGRGMNAVIAFARSQVGKRYVRGGEGPGGFDCSGFTKRAYARAGLRLPHSSGAQARRARTVSRAQARPGDLVVGPGHVGIYMGRGMMIDAGNHRTGVVYRKLYRGLRVARL